MIKFNARESKFFDLFAHTAKDTSKAAELLEDMMCNYTDVHHKMILIEDMENKCDTHVHNLMQELNKSFITPIDREDIFLIAKEMDNITDAIEGVAHRFVMFNVTKITPDAIKLVKMITRCTRELMCVMEELRHVKYNKHLMDKIIEVNRIEDEADTIHRNAIETLFKEEKNAIEIIKWKEIYEFLENTIDACEDVANIIEGVVMKHA